MLKKTLKSGIRMRNQLWMVALFALLTLGQAGRAEDVKHNRVYVSPGLHQDYYAVFHEEGTVTLLRSDRPPSDILGMRGEDYTFTLRQDELSFKETPRSATADLLPLRGKLNPDGSLSITYKWLFNNKERTVVYELSKGKGK